MPGRRTVSRRSLPSPVVTVPAVTRASTTLRARAAWSTTATVAAPIAPAGASSNTSLAAVRSPDTKDASHLDAADDRAPVRVNGVHGGGAASRYEDEDATAHPGRRRHPPTLSPLEGHRPINRAGAQVDEANRGRLAGAPHTGCCHEPREVGAYAPRVTEAAQPDRRAGRPQCGRVVRRQDVPMRAVT